MGRWLRRRVQPKARSKSESRAADRSVRSTRKRNRGGGFGPGSPTHRTVRDEWGTLGSEWDTLGSDWNTLGSEWRTLGSDWNTLGSEWRPLIRRVSFVC